MWTVNTPRGSRQVLARDETLRDGNQSEVPRSAWRGISHIIEQAHTYDIMTIGWIYASPADRELANYLRAHDGELSKRVAGYDKNKFLIYSLVHRGAKKPLADTLEDLKKSDPLHFGTMLRELQTGKQPYGIVNVLTKARCKDLEDLGLNSETLQENLANTIHLIKEANPSVTVEIALEHFYTAWLEEPNQAANRTHIVDTIVSGLLAAPGQEGGVRITAPDTDGAHTADEVTQVIREVTEALQHDERLTQHVPPIHFDPAAFIAHMHDDLGHAAENTKAALEAGAGSFDSTAGIMGERRGNVTAAAMAEALGHPDAQAIKEYQKNLAKKLGLQPGDKPIGSPEAQSAVGGMHGHALYVALRAAQKQGMDYDTFVKTYKGSYASAHPEGVPLQATLSPVAGAANVLFMLSRLGLDLDDKTDSRIAKVLAEVKNGEFERGENYRGYNNANALLLLANTFGLREHHVPGRKGKNRTNDIRFSFDPIDIADDMPYVGKLSVSHGKAVPYEHGFMSSHRSGGFRTGDGREYSGLTCTPDEQGGFLRDVADHVLVGCQERLIRVDKRFGDLQISEAREFEVPVGRVDAEGSDPLKPVPEKVFKGVKLIFTSGTQEWFQANGVGATHEEALGKAVQTMLDFRCLQIEQENVKERISPILDVRPARAYLAGLEKILRDGKDADNAKRARGESIFGRG